VTSSKGIVLFAYNSTYDYVKLANISAALTKKFIGYPVTLITNSESAPFADLTYIDNVIEFDATEINERVFRTTHDTKTEIVHWKNLTRASVYELSPYDQTLLIDCDYFVMNDNLVKLFDTNLEFTCHRDAFDITGMNAFRQDSRLSPYGIPMLWATVVYFTKCEYSKSIFDMMKLIKENYHYYATVYSFKEKPFRNDFALSIAYHALSGYTEPKYIPYKLPSLSSTVDVIDFRDNGQMIYQYKNNQRIMTGRIQDTDLHIMNKLVFTDEIVNGMLNYATS